MNERVVLRSLKGAPLSVLCALWLFGPSNRKDLIGATGWKKGAIDDALQLLEGQGMVVRPSYRSWALSDGSYQLPLFNYPLNGLSANNPQAVDNLINYPFNGPSSAESPKNGPSSLVSSSRSILTNKEEQQLPEIEPDQIILDVCRELGIYGRKRDGLARLDHVVQGGADYVRGHVEAAPNVGLAIWRMEEGWNVPGKRPSKDAVPEKYRDVVVR